MASIHEKTQQGGGHKAALGKLLFLTGISLLVAGLIFHLAFRGSPILALSGIILLALHIIVPLMITRHGRKMMNEKSQERKGFVARSMMALHGHSHGAENAPQTEGLPIHWGKFYDIVVWLFFGGKEKNVRKQTIELANIQPGDKILDVGCGTGTLTLAAGKKAGPAGEAHGIDASPEMIEVADKKVAGAGSNAVFKAALIEAIPFPDEYFDVVLSSLMIHHLPGAALKQKAFSEMRRVLKPGGRILIVDFEPPVGPISRRIMAMLVGADMMKSNVQAILPMMKQAGFIGIKSGGTKSGIISFVRGDVEDQCSKDGAPGQTGRQI